MNKVLTADKFGNEIQCNAYLYCIANRKKYIVTSVEANLGDGYRKLTVRCIQDLEERTIYNDSLHNYSVVKQSRDGNGNRIETGDILHGVGITGRVLGVTNTHTFLEVYNLNGNVTHYVVTRYDLMGTHWHKKTVSGDIAYGEWILFQGHKLQKTPALGKYWNTHTLDFTTISPCEEVCRTSGPATE